MGGRCGIGTALAVPSCQKVGGATSAPLTTAKPCVDKYSNCADLAKTNCKQFGESCAKSCGLCDGMTPHPSNTCAGLAESYCYQDNIKTDCCISCGLGPG